MMSNPVRLYKSLLPYQVECVSKLNKLKCGANFMDMGTGKTLTMVAIIKEKWGKFDRILWFCPVSTIENLKRNLEENSNILDLNILEIFGIESISQSDRTYLKVLSRLEKYKKVMIIVDESILIKNYFAKRSERLIYVAGLCKYKYILNGTPITKSIVDLFSQFYLLDRRIIGYNSYYSFSRNHLVYDDYGKVRNVLDEDYIMQRITPFTYKIKKEECLDLPNRNFDKYYYELTHEQMIHYYDVKEKLLYELEEDNDTTIYRLFTALQLISSGRRVMFEDTGSCFERIISENFYKEPRENPRIQALVNIISQEYCKTIIWCKYTHEIDSIAEVLRDLYSEDDVCIIKGSISPVNRDKEIERFRKKARFLVANKGCGGFGLNLQFCSRAIYYNNDFNWGTRKQSLDRIYRLGQTEKVFVTDICASYKIDERILENLKSKTNIAESFSKVLKNHNKEDIDRWLDNRKSGENYKRRGKKHDPDWFEEIEKTTRDTELH